MVLLIVLCIFWLAAYLHNFFITKKNKPEQRLIFECGFKSFSGVSLSLHFNFFSSTCLIILYELEFLFILPFMFNSHIIYPIAYFLFSIFFLSIIVTIILDSLYEMVEWVF